MGSTGAIRDLSAANIGLEILRHKLHAIAREMAMLLGNAAQLAEINQDRDFATGLVDRAGNVVAIDNPVQIGAVRDCAREAMTCFKFDMREGDVVLVGDPRCGGTRVTDFTLVKPLFVQSSVVLYLVVRARIPDIGGEISGGLCPRAVELLGEGVPVPPMKIRREGRPVRDLMTTVLLNSRKPEALGLALSAMMGAIDLGGARIIELIDRFTLKAVTDALQYCQDYTERRVRAAISQWKDGEYTGSSTLENDGRGRQATVRVALRISGNEMLLDFDGSDEQHRTFVDSTMSNTTGAALLPILVLVGEDVPANSGALKAVKMVSSAGRITSMSGNTPVGWSPVHCGAEITESVAEALRKATGPSYGSFTTPSTLLTCRPARVRGTRLDVGIWGIPGCSASEGSDGWGRPSVSSRSVLPSIEEWEASTGIGIEGFEFALDSAGAGRWRGAPATETSIRLPSGYVYTLCREGSGQGAAATGGGTAGSKSVLDLVGPAAMKLPACQTDEPLPTGVLRLSAGSGAGYGPACERTPEAVLDDVLDELVSPECATRVYSVALSKDGMGIDAKKTNDLRTRRTELNG